MFHMIFYMCTVDGFRQETYVNMQFSCRNMIFFFVTPFLYIFRYKYHYLMCDTPEKCLNFVLFLYFYFFYNKERFHTHIALDRSQMWNTCTFSQHPGVSVCVCILRIFIICFLPFYFWMMICTKEQKKKIRKKEHNHEYLREIF